MVRRVDRRRENGLGGGEGGRERTRRESYHLSSMAVVFSDWIIFFLVLIV